MTLANKTGNHCLTQSLSGKRHKKPVVPDLPKKQLKT